MKEFKAFVGSFQSLSQILRTRLNADLKKKIGEKRWPADLLSSPVETVMKKSPSITEDATINGAILAFGKCAHTLLPIVDTEGKLDKHRDENGCLSRHDSWSGILRRNNIGTIARREVAALYEGQEVRDALRVLYMKDVEQAPVLDDHSRPVGILSHMDVAEARIRLEHQKSDSYFSSSHNPHPRNKT